MPVKAPPDLDELERVRFAAVDGPEDAEDDDDGADDELDIDGEDDDLDEDIDADDEEEPAP